MANRKGKQPTEALKVRMKKGDLVEVVTGKERGKRGTVLAVDRRRNRVLVEGVNFVYRHTRPTQQSPQGGIVQREAFLHASNVMVIDPESDRPTRIGIRVENDGRRIRIARRSGRPLDKV